MAAEMLRDELMALPGVAEAEVDESGESPSGVRIRLEPDADAKMVGAEVQRVLSANGMNSRVSGQEPVVGMSAPNGGSGGTVTATVASPTTTATDFPPPLVPPVAAMSVPALETPKGPPPSAGLDADLTALRVEESAEGVAVTAFSSDGRSLSQRSGPTQPGMYEAIVSATGALADGRPPLAVNVKRAEADGSEVLTVVVQRSDGSRLAGAAVVRADLAWAVARATWAALRG